MSKSSIQAQDKNPSAYSYDTSKYIVMETKIRRDSETGRFIVKDTKGKDTSTRA